MSDDETMVRQRLSRLLGARTDPALRPALRPAAADPSPPLAAGRLAGLDPSPPLAAARMAGLDPSAPLAPGRLAAADPPSTPASVSDRLAEGDPPAPGRLAGPGAFDPGRRGVRALAVVAAVVALGAAGWAWSSRPDTQPVDVAAGASPAASRSADPSTDAPGAEVVVAVAGKVRRPGLVRLPVGARVADAIASAGGVLPGTDVALLNLARKVSDGELILVGVTAPPGGGGVPDGSAAGAPGAGPGGGKVNLNTATLAQLDALPGVGPVLAQRILDHRERRGGFRSVSDLRQVDGIGDARYEDLKELVSV